ncbi:MAG TPA: hypothetical protein VK909_04355, partial [Anaerolineales bacterium]|nr:hypothetical protein [Anaerolineales bacterium]
MSTSFLSTCRFYPFLLATSMLLLGVLACGGAASPPEASAGAPGATAPAPVENPTNVPVTAQPA